MAISPGVPDALPSTSPPVTVPRLWLKLLWRQGLGRDVFSAADAVLVALAFAYQFCFELRQWVGLFGPNSVFGIASTPNGAE